MHVVCVCVPNTVDQAQFAVLEIHRYWYEHKKNAQQI